MQFNKTRRKCVSSNTQNSVKRLVCCSTSLAEQSYRVERISNNADVT
jgi:hypothetical protein